MSGLDCYILSYDIMDRKRLCRVHRAMKGFSELVHYSVFRCHIAPRGHAEMVAALMELIDLDEDHIMIIDMGSTERGIERRIEFFGAAP